MASESKDLISLARLVADMRDAQRKNQKALLFSTLEAMRRFEAEVDGAVEAILGEQLTKRATKRAT